MEYGIRLRWELQHPKQAVEGRQLKYRFANQVGRSYQAIERRRSFSAQIISEVSRFSRFNPNILPEAAMLAAGAIGASGLAGHPARGMSCSEQRLIAACCAAMWYGEGAGRCRVVVDSNKKLRASTSLAAGSRSWSDLCLRPPRFLPVPELTSHASEANLEHARVAGAFADAKERSAFQPSTTNDVSWPHSPPRWRKRRLKRWSSPSANH